jgi:hypothetical protein
MTSTTVTATQMSDSQAATTAARGGWHSSDLRRRGGERRKEAPITGVWVGAAWTGAGCFV